MLEMTDIYNFRRERKNRMNKQNKGQGKLVAKEDKKRKSSS
jgi:hypothetical protein